MDLRQLRYFVAIVEHGSFSKAAAALNVAQPALSQHVRNMEAELGTILLFRAQSGVTATEAGEILLRNARGIIDQFAIAHEEIKGHDAEPSGEVSLGLPGTIGQIVSVPLILAARSKFPKIKLRIAEAMSGFVTEWVRDGRVDLAVIYEAISDKTLHSYPVITEELCLLGPSDSEKPGPPDEDVVDFNVVANLDVILPSSTHGLRKLIRSEAERHGMTLNAMIEVDSFSCIKELVERGIGYSILPFKAVSLERRAGRLRTWRLEPQLRRNVHLVRASDRPQPNAVAAIEILCRDILLDLVEQGIWEGADCVFQ